MIIGISGKAGSGKDTVADLLVQEFNFVKVSLADPLKRICRDVFAFTDEQLWGPSGKRNEPDLRYPRDNKFIYPAAPEGALWFPVSGGRTLINEADLDLVLQHKWCVNKKEAGKRTNYVRTWDSSLKLHQLLMGPAPEGHVIDHINGDGMDNRRENLRFCTHTENHANEGKRRGGSSSFKGVGFDKERSKWYAKLTVGGETRNLGRFDSEEAAAMAYDKAASEEFGEHARTNAEMFLTPRYALQQLGTNWGRNCYPNVWVDYALRVADQLLSEDPIIRPTYSVQHGVDYTDCNSVGRKPGNGGHVSGVAIPDVRFKNEVDGLKRAGAKLIRVKRPDAGLSGNAGAHRSEMEQDEIPDSDFDFVINNDGSLEDLCLQVEQVMKCLKSEAEEQDRADTFAKALSGIGSGEYILTKPVETTLSEEGETLTHRMAVQKVVSLEQLTVKGGVLSDLLRKRAEDVEAGRLMEYDESQKDIPPFKRTRNP